MKSTNKRFKRMRWRVLAPLAAAALVACGGGGSASGVLSGVAVDGYLQGATVFLDVNGDGLQTAGEPSAVTDSTGRYTLDTSSVRVALDGLKVVVTGGVDTDTGYAFEGRLVARVQDASAGQVVTPLTTLVDAVVAQGLAPDVAAARTLIANALGLSSTDLAQDPMALLNSQPGVYATQVALQRAVQLLAAANAGESAHHAQGRVVAALATAVAAQTSQVQLGALVSQLAGLKNRQEAGELADRMHDAVERALRDTDKTRGKQKSRAVIKALDDLRLKAQNSGDYQWATLALAIDQSYGLTERKPVSRLFNGDDSDDDNALSDLSGRTASITIYQQPVNTTGRLLASNCFQCHGTGGVGGFDNIRGSEASEVREYLTKPANSNIMAAHAQGYTRGQLDAIIAYLQQR